MDGSFDGLPSRRKPLLGADGQWDRVALAAWFQDVSAWKARMPDDRFRAHGLIAGDLLITDDAVEPSAGGTVLVTDEEMFSICVDRVELDGRGRCCFCLDGDLVPLDDEDSPIGVVLMVVGFVPLDGREMPVLADLLRAQAMPDFGPIGAGPLSDSLPY